MTTSAMKTTVRSSHGLLLLVVLPIVALMQACGPGDGVGQGQPRWACPSPEPRPYGETGPVKEQIPLPTAEPSGPQEYQNVYYEEWEQEYPNQGPPFPSPTPYGFTGTSFVFGQRIELPPVHVQVTASAAHLFPATSVPTDSRQLYLITITWTNTGGALPIDYHTGVRLRAITAPDGRILSDSRWGMTTRALELAGLPRPSDMVLPGQSSVQIPILAPEGQPKVVELQLLVSSAPALPPTATTLASTPTVTPVPTATPVSGNPALQDQTPQFTTIQWVNGSFQFYGAPPCGDPGALTSWDSGQAALPAIPPPPGVDRVVQLAMLQQGKRYVWGAVGPETFDCSGLMVWSYAQIGLRLVRTSAEQYATYPPIPASGIRSGDLLFFDTLGKGRVTHVGMAVVGSDGTLNMIHAANPDLGVRYETNILASRYWVPLIVGFATVR